MLSITPKQRKSDRERGERERERDRQRDKDRHADSRREGRREGVRGGGEREKGNEREREIFLRGWEEQGYPLLGIRSQNPPRSENRKCPQKHKRTLSCLIHLETSTFSRSSSLITKCTAATIKFQTRPTSSICIKAEKERTKSY